MYTIRQIKEGNVIYPTDLPLRICNTERTRGIIPVFGRKKKRKI